MIGNIYTVVIKVKAAPVPAANVSRAVLPIVLQRLFGSEARIKIVITDPSQAVG
jgi:hypothetical protein